MAARCELADQTDPCRLLARMRSAERRPEKWAKAADRPASSMSAGDHTGQSLRPAHTRLV